MITTLVACAIATTVAVIGATEAVVPSHATIPIAIATQPFATSTYVQRKKVAIEKRKARRAKLADIQRIESKRISFMTYDELVGSKNRQLDNNNMTSAIKYVKQILKVAPNTQSYIYHMIELADLLFATHAYVEALQLYTTFCQTHGGHVLAEYAGIKAIICSFIKTRCNDRDQSQTEATIQLADQFLTRSSSYQTYTSLARDIRNLCYQKLIASEASIFHFFIKQDNVVAARKRLEYLHTTWIDKVPELTSQYAALEQLLLAHESGHKDKELPRDCDPFYLLGTDIQKNELLARVNSQVHSPITRITT